MGRLLNCWLVHIYYWFKFRGKEWGMVRRSIYFFGTIPHFAMLIKKDNSVVPKKYKLLEYVPKRPGVYTFILFNGIYRINTYILTNSVEVHSKKEADQLIGE